jgi:hypothetical protein
MNQSCNKALVCNPSVFNLFAPNKSWVNVRSSSVPHTEFRQLRSVANKLAGFCVVGHYHINQRLTRILTPSCLNIIDIGNEVRV